jgi:Trk K+ transport system NAD-binding subunit
MKILIIGGTGRISLSVTRELDSIGFDVTVINTEEKIIH